MTSATPRTCAIALMLALLAPVAAAATLPPHAPLRILIVSDRVNPNSLPPSLLTEPGDLSAAIAQPGSGISIDSAAGSLIEIATDDLAQATALLSVPITDPAAYDVVLYFAHRTPNIAGGAAVQAAFEAAVEQFLIDGGGFVSFHHGTYRANGKAGIAELIGAAAVGGVQWDTVNGQNVINVAPSHFVTSFGVTYPTTTSYDDIPNGVPAGTYGLFNNTPDEQYPTLTVNPSAGDVEILFASNYNNAGTRHILGFTHRQPSWAGIVVAYQPGEYQPNALDDLNGNNFQILANALLYAATGGAAPVPAGGATLSGALALLIGLAGSRRLARRSA